jgi:hypothetical protein
MAAAEANTFEDALCLVLCLMAQLDHLGHRGNAPWSRTGRVDFD